MPPKKPAPVIVSPPGADPLWYKDAIVYQVHVRAYRDSNGDGVGDFPGLTSKLDYIRDLGVTAIWLLPFYPSPLRDDGYDIADYTDIHPAYGTLADFRVFLREAHRRNLRVITELVINHTSDQHPWFQRARQAPAGSAARDFYVWSDDPHRYREARIIFKDFEVSNWTWDSLAKSHYWHRFYAHQPDLNFENPAVRRSVLRALDFWLGMGVDGLRLDAVPYLCEREGTNCENLPETHAVLRDLRAHVDSHFPGRMLLAEANQWPEDAVAYFGAGDECHMAFHFPLMPRMFMALRMEDRYPIIDILAQTPAIPEVCQWAIFLRNHDELTLEMVTDEERDYMYRVYAADPQARINLGIRRRLAPLLGNERRRIELMNGLLCSLTGTPTVYYGDEIGMGDNIYVGDRNGVRTPMQWSADRNAGFSEANAQRLFLPVIVDSDFSYATVNVATQAANPHSLLWWMRRLLALRKRFKAFSRGSLEFLFPSNPRVLAFIRAHENERVLVVANLSRHVQCVELDLAPYRDLVPIEAFGHTTFPRVEDRPYMLTLGPHAFYWLSLEVATAAGEAPRAAGVEGVEAREMPEIQVASSWDNFFKGRGRAALEELLPAFLATRRWFGGKARRIRHTEVMDAIAVPMDSATAFVVPVRVEYVEGDPEIYLLTLALAIGERAEAMQESGDANALARVRTRGTEGVLHEALSVPAFSSALLDTIVRKRRLKGAPLDLAGVPTTALRRLRGDAAVPLAPYLAAREQSNSSVFFGDRLVMKLFRRLEEGEHPEVEIGTYLTARARFPHVPAVAGTLMLTPRHGSAMAAGVLMQAVPNEGDAWSYSLDAVGRFLERRMARGEDLKDALIPAEPLLALSQQPVPELAADMIEAYLETARLLGQRTAELHIALGKATEPAFAPEPFTPFYVRSLYQSMRNLTERTTQLLRQRLDAVPDPARAPAQRVLSLHGDILGRFRTILGRRITAMRTRIHGDYHLGQVLRTGRDLVIIDFEGEPALSISTRRIKRSPLRDVAGMIRSFHYAAHGGLQELEAKGVVAGGDGSRLRSWVEYWFLWVAATFLAAYLERARDGRFLPSEDAELGSLLEVYVLEKSIYELGYELNNRPSWVRLPLEGILRIVDTPEDAE